MAGSIDALIRVDPGMLQSTKDRVLEAIEDLDELERRIYELIEKH